MKHRPNLKPLAMMLLIPALLVSGCASVSPNSPPPVVVAGPRNPPLPAQALQPTPPEICLPSCSAGLTKLRTELLNSLPAPMLPASPASGSTAKP